MTFPPEYTGPLLDSARDFVQSLFDITVLEGKIEKARKDLINMSDFNYTDAFHLLTNLQHGKKGIDCDDFF